MAAVHRRVTYKLYPSPDRRSEMERVCDLHRALVQRRAARADRGIPQGGQASIGFATQCKSVTLIRRDDPAYRGLNAQSFRSRSSASIAPSDFFRRVKAGRDAGLPKVQGPGSLPRLRLQDPWRRLPLHARQGLAARSRCACRVSARCGRVARPARRAGSSARTSSGRRMAGISRWSSSASRTANGARPSPDWIGVSRPSPRSATGRSS